MMPIGYVWTGDLYSAPSGLIGLGVPLPRASAKAAFCGFHLCPGLSYFAPLGLKSAQDSWRMTLLDKKIPKYFSDKHVGNDERFNAG